MGEKKLSARLLNYILIACLLLIAVGSGTGFYFTQNILKEYATSASELTSKAAAGSENVAALSKIREYLATHQAQREKVKKIVGESAQYNYRDEVVKELSRFARESRVQITSINFSETASGQTAPSSGSSAPAQSTPSATTPNPASGVSGQTAPAVKSSTFNVAIKNPVNYRSLLTFISKIEQNVTKMQISQISLTTNSDNGQLSSESFNIEVYLR
ncbi:MAG TPA: hypothetical protein VGE34_03110 [Candidatus Saccharimonadales bacterium]